MMVWLPHTAFEGAIFPAIPQTQASILLAIQQQLNATQYLPPEQLRALQFAQVAAIVSHIDRYVPHYGVSLRKAGIRPGEPISETAWQKVPILSRRAVQDAGDRLSATHVPASHGEIAEITTSGTSGMPVRICHTKLHHLYWQSFQLREELWHKRDLQAVILGIRRDDQRKDLSARLHVRRFPDWGNPVATVYPTGPSVMLDYRSSIADQVEFIRAEEPAYLTVYPSVLLEILRHCRHFGIGVPSLRQVRTVRETLPFETRQLCYEVLGVGIADVYSCAEAGNLAVQCPEQGSYHLQQENALIEVLDDEGQNCGPGQVGRVVLTPLHNFAMPLLRYELGDLVEVGGDCPCGRTLPVIRRILGRARDMLTLPDGSKRYPYYGHNAMMTIRAIRQHQLIQTTPDTIQIRLVVSEDLTPKEKADIRAIALEGLGYSFKIDLQYVDEIKREPSGKFAEFRSEVTV